MKFDNAQTAHTVTLSAALSVGDTSISVSATTDEIYSGEEIVFADGTRVIAAAGSAAVIGSTAVSIEASPVAQSSSAVGTVYANTTGARFLGGSVTRALYGVWIVDYTDGVLLEGVDFFRNYRTDIQADSANLTRALRVIGCNFRDGNTSDGTNRPNIFLNYNDGAVIEGNTFNEDGTRMQWAIELRADASNTIITGNVLNAVKSGSTFVYKYAQSATASSRGVPLLGANRLNGHTLIGGSTGYDLITTSNVP